MSLAILHLQPTTPRSLPVVSTHSYQRQHQLKYLIWPIPDRKAPPWNLIQVRQMLEEHQKKRGGGGSCRPLLLVRTAYSHVNLSLLFVLKRHKLNS